MYRLMIAAVVLFPSLAFAQQHAVTAEDQAHERLVQSAVPVAEQNIVGMLFREARGGQADALAMRVELQAATARLDAATKRAAEQTARADKAEKALEDLKPKVPDAMPAPDPE